MSDKKHILFYLGHPAQYHFIKHTLRSLENDGHKVKVLIKTKDILEQLLQEDGIEYTNIQNRPRGRGKIAILTSSLKRTAAVVNEARKFKADILLGTDSSIAQAGWLLHKPAITALEDDYEVIKNLAKLTYPFTSHIIVPDICNVGPYEDKKISYRGYMKLAYLHPNVFTSDKSMLAKYRIEGNFVLIRLAQLTAHHDVGIKGLNIDLVKAVIQMVEEAGYKPYITSESKLDASLTQYQLKIKFTDIHHVLAYAGMLISDSQSMSVEAAMLGVPSIRFSDFTGRISVLDELEKRYGLTFGIKTSDPKSMIVKLKELLEYPDLAEEFKMRRKKMLTEKIDVSAYFTWIIENYPESVNILKKDDKFQMRFN